MKGSNTIDAGIGHVRRFFGNLADAGSTALEVLKGDKKLEVRELTAEERANKVGNLDQLSEDDLKALQSKIHQKLNDKRRR